MQEIFSALGLEPHFDRRNKAQLSSRFAVSYLAACVIGAVGRSVSEFVQKSGLSAEAPTVSVDQTLASLWFSQSIQAIDWQMPPIWDAIAGDYQTLDGWVKLHTNLPHHRDAAISVLKCEPLAEQVKAAVVKRNADELEAQIIEAGGVAAKLRSRQEWRAHQQGRAIALEPLIAWSAERRGQMRQWRGSRARPLRGLRVLDLTRVLAGPVSTRTLAGFGAEVLRIDPPGWDEANVVPDITLGKRCANLRLTDSKDRLIFEQLLSNADVLIHGYRPGALNHLGYCESTRHQISPNLIEVSLSAYGWTGPWAQRRGFDSLVQMSCGIAHEGMSWARREKPTPLPVQALDHATGYLMAAAVIKAITNALCENELRSAKLSLARTAELLITLQQQENQTFLGESSIEHFASNEEVTPWGRAKRLKPPLSIDGIPMRWDLPASKLGSAMPHWM